jgi:hypothetical protein
MALTYQELLGNLSKGLAGQDFMSYAKNYNIPVTYNQDTNRLLVNNTPVDMQRAGLELQQGLLMGTEQNYGQLLAPFIQQTGDLLAMAPYETPDWIKTFVQSMAQQQLAPWAYNLDEDPAVIDAREQLENTMSEMAGKRGFLYGSAQQDLTQAAFNKIAPMFEETAYRRREDFLNRQLQLANTIMQWDDMQARRTASQNELTKVKADFLIQLNARDLEVFKTMLSQRRFEMELALEDQRFEMEKKEKENEIAWKKIDELGYVDNSTSVILGIPAGTVASWAKKMIAQHQYDLNISAQKHKYDLEMLLVNKKIEMELINERERVNTESQMKLMEIEYGFKTAMAEVQEKHRREVEAKRKAEAEAQAKKAEEAARIEAQEKADAKFAEEKEKTELNTEYKYASSQLKAKYVSNYIIPEKKQRAAVNFLTKLYFDGTISNPTYNRLIAEYGLPAYDGSLDYNNLTDLQRLTGYGMNIGVNPDYHDWIGAISGR